MTNIQGELSIPRDGLVGEWLLDGNSYDTSGNGNNGTATNITWVDAEKGYVKQVASFDGSSSYLTIDQASNSIVNNFTENFWYKYLGGNLVYFKSFRGDLSSGTYSGYHFYHTGTDTWLRRATGTGTLEDTIFNDDILNDGKVHMLTITQSSTNGSSIYIDSVLVKNEPTFTADIVIGKTISVIGCNYDDGTTNNFSNVNIQLNRIYNRTLSQKEINALYLEGQRKLGLLESYPKLFNGCVAYYDFKNGGLSNLIDGIKATNNGATLTTDHLGNSNSAYYFDGVSSSITIGGTSLVGLTNNSFTFRINTSNTNTQDILEIGRNTSNYTNTIRILMQSDGTILYQDYDGTNLGFNGATLSSINDGNYHTITISKTYPNLYFYIDGILDNTITSSYNITTANSTSYIGYNQRSGTEYWNGIIDNIIVHNRGINSNEVNDIYNLTKKKYIYPFAKYSPIALPRHILHIDGTNDGTTYYDQSGNGNNGTQSGGVTTTQYGLYKEILFSKGQRISTTNTFTNSIYTIEIKVNFTTLYDYGLVLGNNEINFGFEIISYSTGEVKFYHGDGNTWLTPIIFNAIAGKQYIFTIVVNGSNRELYVNGKLFSTDINATALTSSFNIGARSDDVYPLDGKIYSVKMWDKPLTQTQIQQLYYSNYIQ